MAKRIIDVVNRSTARTWLALLVTLLPAPVTAATVRLETGQVVEGTVQGRVLVIRATTDGDVMFRMLEGKDISSIDEAGIHATGETIVLMGMKGATAEDVMQGLIWWREGRDLKKKRVLIRAVGQAQVMGARFPSSEVKSVAGDVLGEYRIDHGRKAIEILAEIRLKKPDGTVVAIPAAEIMKSRGGS